MRVSDTAKKESGDDVTPLSVSVCSEDPKPPKMSKSSSTQSLYKPIHPMWVAETNKLVPMDCVMIDETASHGQIRTLNPLWQAKRKADLEQNIPQEPVEVLLVQADSGGILICPWGARDHALHSLILQDPAIGSLVDSTRLPH